MAENDGRLAHFQCIHHGSVRRVRQVDDHAKPIHLRNDLFTEVGQAHTVGQTGTVRTMPGGPFHSDIVHSAH